MTIEDRLFSSHFVLIKCTRQFRKGNRMKKKVNLTCFELERVLLNYKNSRLKKQTLVIPWVSKKLKLLIFLLKKFLTSIKFYFGVIVNKTQKIMDEFKSVMVDFLKFQHEQQKRMKKKQLMQQKENGSNPAGYIKRTAWNSKTNINQTTKNWRNHISNSTRAKKRGTS